MYLVPTPIGNPRDITLRAIDVLQEVAIVAAEDTRHARSLLQPLGIDTRLLSYHDHNEESRGRQLLAALRAGEDVAVISDAGTPLVNDPGFRLVTAAIEEGFPVRPLPGASAVLTALIGSGLPVNRFQYVGFLPRRSAARRAALQRLERIDASLIFFEAPHRLPEALEDVYGVLGDRLAALAVNLTKPDEQIRRDRLSNLVQELAAQDVVRGQYTIVVAGATGPGAPEDTAERAGALADQLAAALLGRGVSTRVTREVIQEVTGLPRNQVYDRVQHAAQRTARPT